MALHCRKSNSEQNVFFTYVCLVKDHKTNENKLQNENSTFPEDGAEIDEKEEPIKVEKSQALYELVKSQKEQEVAFHTNTGSCSSAAKHQPSITHYGEETTDDEDQVNPNILELTKMKWLTEGNDGSPDSRKENALTGAKLAQKKKRSLNKNKDSGIYRKIGNVTSLSVTSLGSQDSRESQEITDDADADGIAGMDRHLSTILKLDKEHNLFGLSSHLTKPFGRPAKRVRKDDRPVFHQTQIVQVCCADKCSTCKDKSHTSYPCSLACLSPPCRYPCFERLDIATKGTRMTSGIVFAGITSRISPCYKSPCCKSSCLDNPCFKKKPCEKSPCGISPCDVNPCGINPCFKSSCCKIISCKKPRRIKKRSKPRSMHNSICCPPSRCMDSCTPFGLKIELTPKTSSVLQKPLMARPCPHCPRCVPPSSCFPYLMPCLWPAPPSAPCSHPKQCFHNPPCPPPKCPPIPQGFSCPHDEPCSTRDECYYNTCLSKNARVQAEANRIISQYGGKPIPKNKSDKDNTCKPQLNKPSTAIKDSQEASQNIGIPTSQKTEKNKAKKNVSAPQTGQQLNQGAHLASQGAAGQTSQASQQLNQGAQQASQGAAGQATEQISKQAEEQKPEPPK